MLPPLWQESRGLQRCSTTQSFSANKGQAENIDLNQDKSGK
jgi:hypothetical protein